jgi:protein gp37
MGQRQLGGDPLEGRTALAKPTVANFAERWLTEHVNVKRKPRTQIEDRRHVRQRIAPWKVGQRSPPAAIKFVGFEPATGRCAYRGAIRIRIGLSGGDSGAGARYMEPEWLLT